MRPPFQSDFLTDEEKIKVSDALEQVYSGPIEGDWISANYEQLVDALGSELCERAGIYVMPEDFQLSVVIPIYNEVRTLVEVVEKVRSIGLNLEMVSGRW